MSSEFSLFFCSMAAIKETSKKLVRSISKRKMSYVLLAKVVDFVGVLLKYKKGKRCNTSTENLFKIPL